jgi:hypothetical protein
MKRSRITTDPDKVRDWINRSRKPLPSMSKRRRSNLVGRAEVRRVVTDRAGGRCEYAEIIPEVRCGFLPGRGMEVDELRGGSFRSSEWLDPDRCRLVCPVHHDWKSANNRDLLSRLGVQLEG